ncbi:MAG: hypothetical protein B9S33_10185 [Pedosphaera sp. Tous-C6FEB]|nr:MAG: hypothetical protein B9S33_10185 [Pedosphaera sp. Tous-C6FEB]
MSTSLAQPRLRILLVDTDYDFFTKVTLLLHELAPRRFVLEWASSYTFATNILRRQRFDLCLVSSRVGHRSGGDLLRHLAANYPGTPAILLAGTEEMMELTGGQTIECLDRHRLSVEMLRQAIRDSLFSSKVGTLLPALQAQGAAVDLNCATS